MNVHINWYTCLVFLALVGEHEMLKSLFLCFSLQVDVLDVCCWLGWEKCCSSILAFFLCVINMLGRVQAASVQRAS